MATAVGLSEEELALIRSVLMRHEEVSGALLFGSRAKSTGEASSDIDLALLGIDEPLLAEEIASELDELPLPNQFDVKAFNAIHDQPLREHIQRVGIRIY